MTLLQTFLSRARQMMTRTIWQPEVLGEKSLRGRSYGALRVASMTWSGIGENNLASRAMALSYSSMLGLGPLVAIAVLVSGVLMDQDFALKQLNRAIEFVAPQVRSLPPEETAQTTENPTIDESEAGHVNPALVDFLDKAVQGTRSKAIGVVGALALIVIVIQLFSSIENAFNDIWGVKRGRNWVLRIVFYWAAVTLGAVLTFAALTLLSTATFVSMIEDIPGVGPELRKFFQWAGPAIAMGVLICVLTIFYKFIPNTNVNWRASLVGATVVVSLLFLNNFLAFLYLRNVVLTHTLYGSLGLLPVLMLGLFVFWLFVLLGGQITYAFQNANYRSTHMAWNDLNHISRRGIALLVFTLIARRFRNCEQPYSAPDLSDLTKVPTQIVNACLSRLITLGLISRLPPDDGTAGLDYRFQPARPLNRITLSEFKDLFETHGDGPSRASLDALDPVVRHFHRRTLEVTVDALGTETFESIINRSSNDLPAPVTETIGTVSKA